MVKNFKGGNKSKGFARKLFNTPSSSSIRLPTNSLEQFAIVTKLFGSVCDVLTLDSRTFKCHIRGKFRGRNKRSSFISIGSIVLIGFRDFESPFKNTDLLDIYDNSSFHSLFSLPSFDSSPFISFLSSTSSSSSSSSPPHDSLDFIFSRSNDPPIDSSTSFHSPSIHSTSIDLPTDFIDI
jgi:hypothetical protein